MSYRAYSRGRASKARAFYPITLDYFPQRMAFLAVGPDTTAAAFGITTSYHTTKVTLPIPRMAAPMRGGQQMVLELLRFEWNPFIISSAAATCLNVNTVVAAHSVMGGINVGTQDPAAANLNTMSSANSTIVYQTVPIAVLGPAGAAQQMLQPITTGKIDLTDGRGHGILYVADAMYVTL